jgi:hypothetical protein
VLEYFYTTLGDARAVEIAGDYACVADGDYGIKVVSISDPSRPAVVNTYHLTGAAEDLCIDGSLLLVDAAYDGGIRIFSLSDPPQLSELGSYYPEHNFIEDIFAAGEYLYIANGPYGLEIVSLVDPANPVKVADYTSGGHNTGVFVMDDLAYLTNSGYDPVVRIVSVSSPTMPSLIADYATDESQFKIVVDDTRAYMTMGEEGLSVLGVEDPQEPYLVSSYFLDDFNAQHISLRNPLVWLTDGEGELRIVSIEDPANPDAVASYSSAYSTGRLAADDSYAYVPEGYGGLAILEYMGPVGVEGEEEGAGEIPRTVALEQNYPNPFNPSTTIRYRITGVSAMPVVLSVYDLHGRRIRTLAQGMRAPGIYSVTWDGRDERGAGTASGVYFTRLAVGGRATTRKMTLLK